MRPAARPPQGAARRPVPVRQSGPATAPDGPEARCQGRSPSRARRVRGRRSDARDLGLHDVRKAAKKLRYASEFATPLMGKGQRTRTRKVALSARGIQTILGGHQDSVVARTLLGRLGAHARVSGASGFTFGRLHAREEHLAADAEADFTTAWRKFPKPQG